MTLRQQFVLVFVGVSAALMAAGGWFAWSATSGALEDELDQKLVWVAGAAAATGLQSSLVIDLLPGQEGSDLWNASYHRLVRLRRYVDAAYLFKRDNTVLVSTGDPDGNPDYLPVGTHLRWLELYREELEQAWTFGEATTPLFELNDRYYKYGFVRLEDSDVMLGVLMRGAYLEGLYEFRRTILLGSLAGALLAALVAGLLAANVTRPLLSLSRAAVRIQRGRLDRPISPARGRELGMLSRAMERMRVGILQRDEQLRLMLAQVAHEIRNPLGGMELFAAAAAETDDPDEQRRLLGRVRSEVAALNRIIQDFMSFARPVSAEIQIHDVRQPIREAVELMRGELDARGGDLIVDLPEEPLTARADPDQVKRVVLNLLRNASQAGREVHVGAEWFNGEVRITVKDDGPGIPEALRERIFDPFVTDKEQGAGLGLAIVRRVAEANGGRVELAPSGNGGGVGAEFRVYFQGPEDYLDERVSTTHS
jgi:signal transduction histidine kinase